MQIGYVSRDEQSTDNSDVMVGDVSVSIDGDVGSDVGSRVMTTYVEVHFDGQLVNASVQLHNATLLLHNQPVIAPLTDTVKLYVNTSQLVQIQVAQC